MQVDIREWVGFEKGTVLVGTLKLEGEQIVLDPPDSTVLAEILDAIILLGGDYYTKAQPKKFLYFLHTKYRPPYFFATKMYDPAQQEPPTGQPATGPGTV